MTDISKDDFIAYEQVRQSCLTNMFDVRSVSELSGLTREQIFEIMENYGELKAKYGGEQ